MGTTYMATGQTGAPYLSTGTLAKPKPARRVGGLEIDSARDRRSRGYWHRCGASLERVNRGDKLRGWCSPGAFDCGDVCPGCRQKIFVADVKTGERPRFACWSCHGKLNDLAEEEASRRENGCADCFARQAMAAADSEPPPRVLTAEELEQQTGWSEGGARLYRLYQTPEHPAAYLCETPVTDSREQVRALRDAADELAREDADSAWRIFGRWLTRWDATTYTPARLTALAEEWADLVAVYGCRAIALECLARADSLASDLDDWLLREAA